MSVAAKNGSTAPDGMIRLFAHLAEDVSAPRGTVPVRAAHAAVVRLIEHRFNQQPWILQILDFL
jgi:hypothetical protein